MGNSAIRRRLFLGLVHGRCMMVDGLAVGLQWAPPSSEVWRPTTDDVDRISWGRPAKKKGTGSRGVPHRLNDEERVLYDLARSKGFLEVSGSGWRRERSDAPLVNTYRSWCDARAIACICLHKGGQSGRAELDQLLLDLSPLRVPAAFPDAAAFCLAADGAADGCVNGLEAMPTLEEEQEEQQEQESLPPPGADSVAASPYDAILAARQADYATMPIHRLPKYLVAWDRPRSEAKTLAKLLTVRLGTADPKPKGRRKSQGGPQIKAGKSRKHGGYGIEG